jgi:energy-coupling factor transporter ATP-binding protein EcfA2
LIVLEEISITGLFGYIKTNYRFKSVGKGPSTPSGDLCLLYGENGAGKSTILKLAFACLCPTFGEGSKSFVARTPFEFFGLTLQDGRTFSFYRPQARSGSFSFRHTRLDGDTIQFHYIADDEMRIKDTMNVELPAFRNSFPDIGINVSIITDNRSFFSFPSSPDFSWTIGRDFAHDEKERNDKKRTPFSFVDTRNLRSAIGRLHSVVMQGMMDASMASDSSKNDVYLQLIKTVVQDTDVSQSKSNPDNLLSRLHTVQNRISRFSRYNLIQPPSHDEFIYIFDLLSNNKRPDIVNVIIDSYATSLENKMDKLESTRAMVAQINETLEEFGFKRKNLDFNINKGLSVFDEDGREFPYQNLSSGERQIVLLLSHLLAFRNRRSVVLIDEPELSLNARWQTLLVKTIKNIVAEQDTCVVMATHSFEMLGRSLQFVWDLSSDAPN